MLSKQDIAKYLGEINIRLQSKGLSGDICLYGDTVMCLVFDRSSIKDIDDLFAPTEEFYKIISSITSEYSLSEDWLEQSVKGFISANYAIEVYPKMSNLKIYNASAEYMFSMKCLSSVSDNKDIEDIKFFIDYLKLNSVDEALEIFSRYYPNKRVLPKIQCLLEELFAQ